MDTDFVISLALNNPDAPITLTETTSLVPYLNASAVDNSTITGLNPIPSTFLTIPKIECDDDRFGEPPVASCKNAIAEIPQDPATVIRDPNRSYGPRGEGTWDVNLPKRYISCASSPMSLLFGWYLIADGQCIIDLTQTSTPSHVRNNDLLAVATIIQDECVEGDTPPCTFQNCLDVDL